jgi:hypothetical protein
MQLAFSRARVSPERLSVWESAAVSATGPRGSLLVYRADTVHRGTGMTEPDGGRFFFNLAYRVAGADWVGANPWPRKGMAHWTPLVERASVRQLEVLGFPPPGHPYWNAETLAGAARPLSRARSRAVARRNRVNVGADAYNFRVRLNAGLIRRI